MANDGRSEWLEAAMERYEVYLARMCFVYLGNISLAEDAVQETFLKAWKGYDSFRGEAEEKTWLTRIAINTCKDLKRSAWFRHTDRSAALDQLPGAVTSFDAKDDTVTRAVMKLKPRYKEVVLLCHYQELTADEAARQLGISRSTVYERLKKAYAVLKRELGEWYDED